MKPSATTAKQRKTPQASVAAGSVSLARKVSAANRWRTQYNPLRGLNLARAVSLLEAYPRGMMADLQWTNFFIEGTDPDLFALVDRRTSAVSEMDWDIKIVPTTKQRKDFDEKLAEEQQAALQEAYDRIENLYETFAHLLIAKFRGYSHAEKARTQAGDVTRFELVDQWNVVRDGFNGDWKYNPDAQSTSFDALPANFVIPPEDFLIREVRRHVDRIALIKFVRTNLSQKDWDAFIEIYGIPGGVMIGPPNVPPEKEPEYEQAAREIAEGGSGYAPHGSEWKPNTGERGTNPFLEHLNHLSEKLILAGTGGLLTMLTQSGSGTLAGTAHTETFNKLAKMDAREISEVLQAQFDKPLLAQNFPGKPILSYFALAQNEELDPTQVVKDAEILSRAGFKMDAGELSEKSGYAVREAPPETVTLRPQADPATADAITKQAAAKEVANRLRGKTPPEKRAFLNSREGMDLIFALLNDSTSESFNAADGPAAAAALQMKAAFTLTLQPVARSIATVLNLSEATAPEAMKNLRAGLPQLLKAINRKPATSDVLAETMTAGFFNGVDDAAKDREQAA